MTTEPLLCELHAHSTWSDGALTIRELVDLYGRSRFDVLAVTDHTCRTGDEPPRHVHKANFAGYLDEIRSEAERAEVLYGLMLVPGLELTDDDPDPRRGAHALALGLHEFVGVDDGLEAALAHSRSLGAALIGAHPYPLAAARRSSRGTARFAVEPEWAATVVDRFELFNRHDVFSWVGRARVPVVATGDFHRLEHVCTWKTLVPCERDEDALVEHLRRGLPVSLTRVDRVEPLRSAAA